MNLFFQPTNTRLVSPDYDKKILGVKPHRFIANNDFNVRKTLAVGANSSWHFTMRTPFSAGCGRLLSRL